MEQNGSSGSLLGKVLGGLFAAIIAPTLTGVAVWYIQKRFDEPKPEVPPGPPAQAVAAPNPRTADGARSEPQPGPEPAKTAVSAASSSSPSSVSLPSSPPAAERKPAAKDKEKEKEGAAPALASTASSASSALKSSSTSPHPTLIKKKKAQLRGRLFNGLDLTGFDTYLGVPYVGTAKKAYGLNNDPEGVFTVHDAELHISGKVFGGLVTTREYENYHMVAEYKWGEKKWPPRNDVPRLGGIILHATGEPGAVHGWSMAGITCVIGETGAGALFLADGMPKAISLRAAAERLIPKKGPNSLVYKPGEPPITVHSGYVHSLGWRPPAVVAKAAAAGKAVKDYTHPVGEWNRLECICEGDRIAVILNGTTVNVATSVSQRKGKLFFISQGADIIFRTINVRPLSAAGSPAVPVKATRP
jgi:hypothetical protein